MRILKKSLFFIIPFVVLAVIYLGTVLYLNMMAKNIVQNSFRTIEALYPQVDTIHYESVKFSPYNLVNEVITIHNIQITFKASDLVLHLDTLQVHNFMGLQHDPFGSFDLSFKNLSTNSVQSLYKNIEGNNSNPVILKLIQHIPQNVKIALSGDANYNANQSSLALNFYSLIDSNPVGSYQVDLGVPPLNRASLSNQVAFLNTLNQTVILNSHYQLNFDHIFAVSDITTALPILGNFLASLRYNTLPVHFDTSSDYESGQNLQSFHTEIAIDALGDLQLDWTLLFSSPSSPYPFFNNLLNPNQANASTPPSLIGAANMIYTEDSFMSRVFDYLGNRFHEPAEQIQSNIISALTAYATQINDPAVAAVISKLTDFIADPQVLTFSLNPPNPFALQDLLAFFVGQRQLNTILLNNLDTLSQAQKVTLFNRYATTTAAAYDAFFNKIGLTVNASTPTTASS